MLRVTLILPVFFVALTCTRSALVEAQSVLPSAPGSENASASGQPVADESQVLRDRIGQWQERAATYQTAIDEAPGRLAAVTAELERALGREEVSAPENSSATELEQALSVAERELAAATREKEALEAEASLRMERRRKLPELLVDAKGRLRDAQLQGGSELVARPPLLVETDGIGELRAAAIMAEIHTYETELRSYEARGELLAKSLEAVALRVHQGAQRVEGLRDALRKARQRQMLEEAARAQTLLAKAEQLPNAVRDAIRQVAQENADMAAAWAGDEGLGERLAAVNVRLERARAAVAKVEAEMDGLLAKVEASGAAESMGALLRKQRAQVPDVDMYRRFVRMRQEQLDEAQLQQIRLREEREQLEDVESRVAEALAEANVASMASEPRRHIEELLRELFVSQLRYMDMLIADHEEYFQRLVDFDVQQRQLIDRSQDLIDFIDAHILWVRSGALLDGEVLRQARQGLDSLGSKRLWAQLARAASDVARTRPMVSFGLGLSALLYVLVARRSRKWLKQASIKAHGEMDGRFASTLQALALTVALALVPPGIVLVLAHDLGQVGSATHFVRGMARGLTAATVLWLTLRSLRQFCRERGLAMGHMGLSAGFCRLLSRQLRWLALLMVPAAGFLFFLDKWGDDDTRESLGRLVYMALMLVVAFFGYHLAGRLQHLPVVEQEHQGHESGERRWPWLRLFVRVGAVAAPISLVMAASLGFYWTALEITVRIHFTLCLFALLLLLARLLTRWVRLAQRRVALARSQEALAQEAAREESSEAGEVHSHVERPSIHAEQAIDLTSVLAQTQQLSRLVLVTLAAVGLAAIWADLLPAASVLDRIELWSTAREVTTLVPDAGGTERRMTELAQVSITLADLLLALLIAGSSWLVLRNLPGLIEVSLFRRLQAGERYAYATIIKYAIGVVGAGLALDALGIGWSSIQWLVAAVGLGLGFGLQEIFANFVSGLIILFERPIRVGDMVTVGEHHGVVSRIRIRATWITTLDRKELVVPNKDFVSSRLINWTLSDQVLRIDIPVGIAYGSDAKLALRILERMARSNARVLSDPFPRALFLQFGDSALNLELRVFVNHPDHVPLVRHELHLAIDQAFREAGIEIAFPQLDVHVRNLPSPG